MGIPSLALTIPDGSTAEFVLGGDVMIGRSPASQIILDNPHVSRKHAVVTAGEDGSFILSDLGSAHGTLLNGARLRLPVRLRDGDRIQIGGYVLRVILEASEPESQVSAGDEETAQSGDDEREPLLLGTSAPMRDLARLVETAGASPISVLVVGETGTGKELVARSIHHLSPRQNGPFVAFNCAAVPESILESELFGHRRGAFTGAVQDRKGFFEAASGGSLFLDEVGEMPAWMQPKLLRTLQEGEVTPVGDTRPRKVDVRIISATNRDLAAEVGRRAFRADLYYRLAPFTIRVPPLRERCADIPLVAERLIARSARRHGKRVRGIDRDALDTLMRREWPGNVRELQNVLERAVALADPGGSIKMEHLDQTLTAPTAEVRSTAAESAAAAGLTCVDHVASSTTDAQNSGTPFLRDAHSAFEAERLANVLEQQGGKVARAARVLGISRSGLHKKLKKHGLR